jgi:hypothetical protein
MEVEAVSEAAASMEAEVAFTEVEAASEAGASMEV